MTRVDKATTRQLAPFELSDQGAWLHLDAPSTPGQMDVHMRGRGIIVVFAIVAFGCRTREDAAHKAAREGSLVATENCADAAAVEECREPICRDRCTPFSDSVHLTETCIAKCMGRGTCSSDLDCDPGRACRMIAPRVRRCEPRTDAGPNTPS